MSTKPVSRRRPIARKAGKPVSKQTLSRARDGLLRAIDSQTWVRAAFRLMLATAPGAFASAALRCTRDDAALWISSNGFHAQLAEMPAMMADHPGIAYLQAHPGLKVLPTRGVLPPQEILEATPFYREFMAPSGWRHAVGLCFWKPGEPPLLDCVLSVHRRADEGDFCDRDIAALGALHAEIDSVRKRVTALEEKQAALSSFEHFVRSLPVPVALLNWELEPLYHNPLARQACALWWEGTAARQRKIDPQIFVVPDEVLAVCREMRDEWRERIKVDTQGECVLVRSVRPTGGGGTLVKAVVRLLFLTGATLGNPNFMVQFELTHRAVGLDRPNLPVLLELSPAERGVVLQAASLKSNAEIAVEIGRSVGTVKAELYTAYKKLGVRNRVELVSLLRG